MSSAAVVALPQRDIYGGINYSVAKAANQLLSQLVSLLTQTLIYSTVNVSLSQTSGISVAAPGGGALIIQLAFSASAALMVSINGTTVYLNSGGTISANSLYEFTLHVASGDTVTILASTATTAQILRVFYKPTG